MGRERGSRWTMPAGIQIGPVHCGDDPSGWRFVIRSSAFETAAKPATAMVMRPTKTATMLRARLTVTLSISVMAPAACVTDRPVRDEGVRIAVAGTYASLMKT
jgi:hypothetical protein